MENLMGRYRNVTILAAAIFLQILGLAIQIKRSTENESSRLIRLWAVSVVSPLEKGIVRVQGGASGIWHNYFYLRGVRQENRELQKKIEDLQLQQVRLKQDAEQARRLQALLGFKEQFIGATTAAQVIGSSGSEQSRLVYVDKGSDDGIRTEMPVITADGIVGKVLNVIDGGTSQVLLINDQQSGVGAILEQSRLQGVLKGKASGELIIDKVMTDEDVKPGDRVLTSGGDRIFPKGLPLGTVAKISKGSEFLQITVKPAASLSRLEEVLVITKREEREAPVSTATTTRAADILAQRLPSVPDKPVTPVPSSGMPNPLAAKPGTGTTVPTALAPKPGTASGTSIVTSKPSTPATDSSAVTAKPGSAVGANVVSGSQAGATIGANANVVPKATATPGANTTAGAKPETVVGASSITPPVKKVIVPADPAPTAKPLAPTAQQTTSPKKQTPPAPKPANETKPAQPDQTPPGDTPQ